MVAYLMPKIYSRLNARSLKGIKIPAIPMPIRRLYFVPMGLPRFGGQASGLHGCECTGVDGLLLVVDRAEVANR